MTTKKKVSRAVTAAAMVLLAACTAGESNGKAACRDMIRQARSITDSLIVFAAKPASQLVTCHDRLIRGYP